MKPTKPMLHLRISPGTQEEITEAIARLSGRDGRYCVPLNLTKYVLAKRDEKLRRAIQGADLVIADGTPIVWLARRLGYSDVHRVTGVDLAESLFSACPAARGSFYFFGASQETVEKATEAIGRRFPKIAIAGFRHGYFQLPEIDGVIEGINASNCRFLLLGLGMPQKEYFIADHRDRLHVDFILPVGGAFDVWAGSKKRAPKPLQKAGLEWLFRSKYDPRKAWNVFRLGSAFMRDMISPHRGERNDD